MPRLCHQFIRLFVSCYYLFHSDVANLKTTAVKTADGKHYVVNGEKKWYVNRLSIIIRALPCSRITNGVFADYFTVAVRTGGEGMGVRNRSRFSHYTLLIIICLVGRISPSYWAQLPWCHHPPNEVSRSMAIWDHVYYIRRREGSHRKLDWKGK